MLEGSRESREGGGGVNLPRGIGVDRHVHAGVHPLVVGKVPAARVRLLFAHKKARTRHACAPNARVDRFDLGAHRVDVQVDREAASAAARDDQRLGRGQAVFGEQLLVHCVQNVGAAVVNGLGADRDGLFDLRCVR